MSWKGHICVSGSRALSRLTSFLHNSAGFSGPATPGEVLPALHVSPHQSKEGKNLSVLRRKEEAEEEGRKDRILMSSH
ncbi:hypothetical protein O3P69_009439 [Scylla paramamosain]|uniref:Uncharacterized protein n=1 Tax=Scylla paramamosain TaxID=85552 RepID=A0AAW0SVL1_SCYPA